MSFQPPLLPYTVSSPSKSLPQRDVLTIATVDDQVVGVVVLLAGRCDVFRGFGKAILVRSVRARLNKSWRPSSKIVDLGLYVTSELLVNFTLNA